MLKITSCTLTGVDDLTAAEDLVQLSDEFPIVEWGFLYSPTRQGLDRRYPSAFSIRYDLQTLPPSVRVALHICGQGVPDVLTGASREAMHLVDQVTARNGRVQLNHVLTGPLLEQADRFLSWWRDLQVITQHNEANKDVWKALADHPNHSVLFDSSLGRGILPAASCWPAPLSGVPCGYAGGLGPDNLDEQLHWIAIAAGQTPLWIDMESSLRRHHGTADRFDTQRCRKVLEIVTERVGRPNREEEVQ